jgi:hypothetical protein
MRRWNRFTLPLILLWTWGLGGCPLTPVVDGDGDEGEGEGEAPSDPLAHVVINEVGCEGDADFVELRNLGDAEVSLTGVLVGDRPDVERAVAVDGTLAPGARLVIEPARGLGCDETVFLLQVVGGFVVVRDEVVLPGALRDATWGRLPDGTGDFVTTSSTPGTDNAAWVDRAAVLFNPLAPPWRLDLTLTPEAEASLRSPGTQFDYAEATFTLSGPGLESEAPLVVGLRKKGKVGSNRSFDAKMAMKIDFDRVVVDQRFRGLHKLNLNNMVQDPSTVHEVMAYSLYARAGLPAPRTGLATVFVNGVEFGTYLMLESFDDEVFLDAAFPGGTGALVEGGLLTTACCDFMDLLSHEVGGMEIDRGDPDIVGRALLDLAGLMESAPSNTVYERSLDVIDWEQALSMMAMEQVIGHWDGYQISPNNYYLQRGVDDPRWRLISGGVDQTFAPEGRVNTVYNGAGILFRRCRESEACRAVYNQKLQQAVDVATAALADGFDVFTRDLAAHHVATFSRARLERSIDNVPALADAALAYLVERLFILRQGMACDGLPEGTACVVDDLNGTCGRYAGGFGCR